MRKKVLAALAMMATMNAAAQQKTDTLSNVVVTGTRNATDVRHLPMTLTVIDRQTLTENYRQNVLPTVMEQVPGMMITSRGMLGYGVSTGGTGGMMLRGISSGSGRMMVLVDGKPQYNGVYGHSIADSYQTLMAEKVEVLRGPASVLYGSNAMGGVMNIVTRKVKADGVYTTVNIGAGSYGTIEADATNQVRSGKFTSTVAAQYGRTDNHRPNMGFEQFGGFVKLGYEISSNWNISANIDLTHFNASNPGSVSEPKVENDQWITRGVASLSVENNYERTSGAITVYDNFGIHKINDGYNLNGGTPQTDLFRSKDAVAGLSWYQSASLFMGNRLTVGVDYQHIYGRAYYTNRNTGEIVTTQRRMMQSTHAHENEIAGYIDFRQDLGSRVTLDAGLRYDHHSTAGGEWVPQFGVVYRPIESGELKGMVSKGFRNPTTKEMYLYGTANHDSLRAESMMNYELSWKHRVLEGRLSYGVNLFFIEGKNMIMTLAGKNVNSGEFRNKGVEVEAAWAINEHWTVNTNHSYLHMSKPLATAPSYKGFIGARCKYGKWSATAGLMQVSGLYLSDGEDASRENFTLLNASVGYQACKQLKLWVKGDNLLAQRYETFAGYPMPRATFMAGVNIAF